MMLPTHALGGMAVALPLLAVSPELAPVALVAGLLGGIFPDLDLYVGHRKTLHYPVYYGAAAVAASLAALLVPAPAT
ncbi:MAG: metal-dependent hydrolase, partial [Haloferacaceae archaeon]